MLRLRLQKIGSLLGLLAILMTTLAPAISQVLAADDRLGQALATYCSADLDAGPVLPDGRSSHSPAFHWQACAYCGMFAHLPVLPGVATVFVASVAIYFPPFYTAAQPRAPPVFS
jgi:hypothetical protein